jgi:type II secretory pathway pseudopilin PulG
MIKINSKGFSLLEILIYITVIAIVTAAIGGVFLSVAGGQARADAAAEVNSNISFALGKINQDILAASAVATPATAGETSAALTVTVGATSITYCVVSGQIFRSAGGICNGSAEPITAAAVAVKSLTFTRLENTNSFLFKTIVSIQTVLTIGYNGANPDYQYSLTKQTSSSLR